MRHVCLRGAGGFPNSQLGLHSIRVQTCLKSEMSAFDSASQSLIALLRCAGGALEMWTDLGGPDDGAGES